MEKVSKTKSVSADPMDGLLCFSVYAAGLAFNRVYKPLLDRFGITYSQYLVLVALSAEDSQTVGILGQKLYLESNTVTPLVKRLEAAGLVTRTRDSLDERVVRVSLSLKGRKVAEEAQRCVPGEIQNATGLNDVELLSLTQQLTRLATTLRDTTRGSD
ncbi:MarR family transcriptional regulator [Brevundimonas sp. LM2]|nr:MarR family transcriptional regulator [Brevundimonas sp. LM2]